METNDVIIFHIALVPPKNIRDLCIESNMKLVLEDGQKQFSLSETEHIPHITLALIPMRQSKIEEALKRIEVVVSEYINKELSVSGIIVRRSSSFEISESTHLQVLHERIMLVMEDFRSFDDVKPDFFFEPELASDSLVKYATNFLSEQAHEKYWPHITLGKGELIKEDYPEFPISFVPEKLVVGQQGPHGTFNNKLKEFKL